MKRLYTMLTVLALLSFPAGIFAQTSGAQHDKCLTDHYYKQMMANDPTFRANQQALEVETQQYVNQYVANKTGAQNKSASVVRVIPVVFHIIHEGGLENISRAQCLNQLETLNADYRRLNADTTNTPSVFKPLGGDCEVEFRIATLDPNGNCTDGVVRVYSPLTNNARDNVKALSYWPSNMYLNVWVVKSIENLSGGAGIVVGFAQFPGGSPLTDGIVLKHDFTGSIGTAANTGNLGRTATHEVGHWLNLRHIWGDAVCGNDFVTDTPTQEAANQSNCPTFPHVTCSNGPNGDMFTNYMDYTNGNCQNIFSIGQCARMNAALSSGTSNRNNLWSSANLIATGTTGGPGALCSPIAAFTNNVHLVCEGTFIDFADGSWNGAPATWSWDFPGGTPSSSPIQNPQVQYNTAGVYDVTLTVTNAAGTDSYTAAGTVTVIPAVGQYSVPYAEGFETAGTFPGTEWTVENEGGNTWVQTTNAAHTGTNAIQITNYTGNTANSSDIFLTPTYNLTNVTQANLTFWLAFAARSSASTDQLKVYASTSCGQFWAIRYNKTGTTLSTSGIIATNYVPTAAQWRQETVNISSATYNNKPNVRFKFEYFQNSGNNIYIDDLNLNGTVGLNEVLEESLAFSVYPNPVMSTASIEFTLDSKKTVRLDIMDVMGRIVHEITETTLDAGEYQFELPAHLASGLYNVRLNADGYVTTRKVLVNN